MKHTTHPTMGQVGLEVWDRHPEREARRAANNGLGMCNTGVRPRHVCALGGLGCDVDHALIAREALSVALPQAEGYRRIAMLILDGSADRDPAAFLPAVKAISGEQAERGA